MADNNRIALVTGANKGIGLEIARQLAQAGVFVIISARDPGRARAAVDDLSSRGLRAQSVLLDLNDHASIAAAAETIRTEHGRLDILVNNAGIVDAEDGPPTASSPAAARRILDTNFVGTLAVTQAMLPLLRQSAAARIVSLSSSLGSLTLNDDPTSPYYSSRLIGYSASKAAVNMLTVQLAEELRETPIVVNSVSPGYVKTDLTGHNGFHDCRRRRETAGGVCAAWRECRFRPVCGGERRDTVVSLPFRSLETRSRTGRSFVIVWPVDICDNADLPRLPPESRPGLFAGGGAVARHPHRKAAEMVASASSAVRDFVGTPSCRPIASAISLNGTPSSAMAWKASFRAPRSRASRKTRAASSRCTDGHRFCPSPT